MSKRRMLLIFSACLLATLSVTGCEKSSQSGSMADKSKRELPKTEEQSLVSGIRLDFLDTSIDPKHDFFRYANGNWLNTTEIPDDKARYGAFTMLGDKARDDVKNIIQKAEESPSAKTKGTESQQIGDFYSSFMNTEKINELKTTPMEDLLKKIESIKTYKELSSFFAQAQRQNISIPFGFYIDNDEKKPTEYIIIFYHSGLGLPDRDYYLKSGEQSKALQDKYRQHIQTMLNFTNTANTAEAANAIYKIEYAIAERHWPREELRDRNKTYNKMTVSDFSLQNKVFHWMSFFETAGITKAENVIVSTPDYFKNIDGLISQFSIADWQHYLKWHALSSYAGLLSNEIDQEDFIFFGKTLSGVEQQQERWKRAVSMLNNLLGDAIGKLYVDEHFSSEAKQRMVELVENLREAYREGILGLEWMGDDTKKKAIEKLEKFTPKIGYPEEWRDLKSLDIKADDLFGNYLRATEFYYQININKLGNPVNKNEWFMNPQTVNAYYNPGMNEIVFPAAILQPPFFNLAADDAINYGAIGGVIGHEMGHGFDDQGAKSDGDGLLTNWWSEQDLKEFTNRTQKLVAQYNSFVVLDDIHVNGELTQGENIGDLSGLTIAYKAYQRSLNDKQAPIIDGFTGEQRFFLGWGQVWANKYRDAELKRRILTDPHSPPRFRTNGVVPNMPEFHQAFGVQEGDAMYLPEKERVKIW
ncbi:MAG: M13 family metallopeptidase [Cellvibrionaceae bacterium]